jgi:hypothetical protein
MLPISDLSAQAPVHFRDIKDRLRAYRDSNVDWGNLHLLCVQGCVSDEGMRECISSAEKEGDTEGAELARLISQMRKSMRCRVPELVKLDYRPRISGKRKPLPEVTMDEYPVNLDVENLAE